MVAAEGDADRVGESRHELRQLQRNATFVLPEDRNIAGSEVDDGEKIVILRDAAGIAGNPA
ncbi:hypothetical protein GCM10028797_21520 [Dyella agri]